jgi:tetratricopeptide (TPR) repeat protein
MPHDKPYFVWRKPTGNPPNWDVRVDTNPETRSREGIYSRLAYGDEDVAMNRVHLAEILYQRGALTEAETNAFQGLAGLRKRFGNQTIHVPNALHTLSQILQAEGRLPEAESALREELAIKQRLWQAKDPRVVQTASNLNQLLQLQGKPTE